jgi:hypothetical protein
LSKVPGPVEAGINNTSAAGGSGTNICLALWKGQQMLPTPVPRSNLHRYVVILSDGDNTYEVAANGNPAYGFAGGTNMIEVEVNAETGQTTVQDGAELFADIAAGDNAAAASASTSVSDVAGSEADVAAALGTASSFQIASYSAPQQQPPTSTRTPTPTRTPRPTSTPTRTRTPVPPTPTRTPKRTSTPTLTATPVPPSQQLPAECRPSDPYSQNCGHSGQPACDDTGTACLEAQYHQPEMDRQTLAEAKKLQDAGIEVYVVAFGVCGANTSGNPDPHPEQVKSAALCANVGNGDHDNTANRRLLKCIASSTDGTNDHYYEVSDASQLGNIFQAIAWAITGRSLTQ